jgi:FlaA1/EpsC-like NDP-sugar epimerase
MQFRNRHFFIADLVLIPFSVLFSFALRLELGSPDLFLYYLPQALWMMAFALLIKPLVFYRFGLYRRLWAYASINELRIIIIANTVASLILAAALALLWVVGVFPGPVFSGFPRSVIAIDWLLSMFAIGGVRFATRLISENREDSGSDRSRERRVLVVGAGDAGALVVREMQKSPRLNLVPVCYLDDDPSKQNHEIYGVPVVGTFEDIASVVDAYQIGEVIIATPSAPGPVVRKVAEACRSNGVPFRTIPGIYELIDGKVTVNRLREVDITDLLRRTPASVDDALVGSSIQGKRLMITGGGGTIGSELCRQVAHRGPSEMVLVGHGENSIYEILLELEDEFPALRVIPVIADLRDFPLLERVVQQYQPDVIFHAAAHKHVVLMESNVSEAISNNVLGTRNLVEAAIESGADRLVMISSDKAIHPTSVMGASKRISEMLVLSGARRSGRAFSVVRFGNVLGSRGSVIPRFKQQIARGGPVTITHPEMERYFMTIPEAVHLVLQASAMGVGGEVFLLNMGEPIRIVDLAEDLIRLSGLEPGEDIEITFTGIQPGEKLSETLYDDGSRTRETIHPEILRLADEEVVIDEDLHKHVQDLLDHAHAGDDDAVIKLLDRMIPNAQVESTRLTLPHA